MRASTVFHRGSGLAMSGLMVIGLACQSQPAPAGTEAAEPGNARATGTSRSQGDSSAAPDVRLQALEAEHPKPVEATRNLFRFKPKPIPPPPQVPVPLGPSPAAQKPAGPTPPPPIGLKFIGIVEAPERSRKYAVLSDGRHVYQGAEGDIIEGRYRILRIGAESVEMAYLDGGGRQTIRLTGS